MTLVEGGSHLEEIFLAYNVFLVCIYIASCGILKNDIKKFDYPGIDIFITLSKGIYGGSKKECCLQIVKKLLQIPARIGYVILIAANKIMQLLKNKNQEIFAAYNKRTVENSISELFGEDRLKEKTDYFFSLAITFILFSVDFVLLIGFLSKAADDLYIVFSFSLCIASAFLPFNALNSMVEKKRKAIKRDFPDFLNRLLLLINAGMNIEAAWNKASESLTGSLLYIEIEKVMYSVKCGKTLSQGFEDFARRCRVKEITRLMSVLVQNMRKGNSEIASILRIHSNECWEMRKKEAQKLGEEASAKMIVPLMLMLIAVLILTMTPAILALYGY